MSVNLVDFAKKNMVSIVTLISLATTIKLKVEANEQVIKKLEKSIIAQSRQEIDFYKSVQSSMAELQYKIGRLEGRTK